MKPVFEIEHKTIKKDSPTYVIAEVGINHNGREETAYELIDAAIEAQVDAVKFQKRHLPSLYKKEVIEHPERYEQSFQYMIPLLKEVELEEAAIKRLKKYCDEQAMTFICTPFDIVSADFLHNINVPAFKIASADLTNDVLLEHIATFGKPMIISTGMALWEEIDFAAGLLARCRAPYAFLHCRSVYPVWPREVNLGMINKLRKFGVPVGYSGHEIGITIALVAASMGAEIIEKHITLDRKQAGPDHKASLEPYEFKRLVRDIRVADQALGKATRYLLRGEVLNRELFAKSLVASEDIAEGTLITPGAIDSTGPAKGLAPYKRHQLLGRRAIRTLKKGDYFTDQDIGQCSTTQLNNSFQSDWGFIVRFTDYENYLKYQPKVLEFHLAENDFKLPFNPGTPINSKLVVHAPEYMGDTLMDLCAGDENIRIKSIERVVETVALAEKIAVHFNGVPRLIVHPGAMSLQEKLDPQIMEKQLGRSVRAIKERLANKKIELLLENLPPYPWYFGGQWKGNYFMDAQEIAGFCEQNDISLCYDLSHSALYCNAQKKSLENEVKQLLPFIKHLHLADGYGLDGEGVQIDEGDIDIKKIIPLFRKFKGTWVPEIWRGHLNHGKGFLEALSILKNHGL